MLDAVIASGGRIFPIFAPFEDDSRSITLCATLSRLNVSAFDGRLDHTLIGKEQAWFMLWRYLWFYFLISHCDFACFNHLRVKEAVSALLDITNHLHGFGWKLDFYKRWSVSGCVWLQHLKAVGIPPFYRNLLILLLQGPLQSTHAFDRVIGWQCNSSLLAELFHVPGDHVGAFGWERAK